MASRYVVGQPVVLTVTFTVASVATDPTTVSLVVTDPAGTPTTYTYAGGTVTKSSTGVYTKTVTASTAGVWSFVWTGTGAAADVQDGTFTVTDDVPLPLYAQVDEVKGRLGDSEPDDDQQYQTACEAVSGWIDLWCEDFFGKVTATRTFEACDSSQLDIPSLVSVTTLKTDEAGDGTYETTWTANTDYVLWPVNPSNGRETKPYTKIRTSGSKSFPYTSSTSTRTDLVQIVGVWGWPAIPTPVREAALILAVDTLKLKDSPFGVAGFGAEGFAVRVKQNPQALSLLAPYRRYPVMVG